MIGRPIRALRAVLEACQEVREIERRLDLVARELAALTRRCVASGTSSVVNRKCLPFSREVPAARTAVCSSLGTAR